MSYQVIPAGFFLGVEQRSRVDLVIGTGFHGEFGNSFYTDFTPLESSLCIC